jgi:hypothetical protein
VGHARHIAGDGGSSAVTRLCYLGKCRSIEGPGTGSPYNLISLARVAGDGGPRKTCRPDGVKLCGNSVVLSREMQINQGSGDG